MPPNITPKISAEAAPKAFRNISPGKNLSEKLN